MSLLVRHGRNGAPTGRRAGRQALVGEHLGVNIDVRLDIIDNRLVLNSGRNDTYAKTEAANSGLCGADQTRLGPHGDRRVGEPRRWRTWRILGGRPWSGIYQRKLQQGCFEAKGMGRGGKSGWAGHIHDLGCHQRLGPGKPCCAGFLSLEMPQRRRGRAKPCLVARERLLSAQTRRLEDLYP